MSQQITMVIAGATGLVGEASLMAALNSSSIGHVYSLSRRDIEIEHPKLSQWLNPTLNPPSKSEIPRCPTVGLISLGTTLKKAGSKHKLYEIDVELVINVAKSMQSLGVQHIIVVSCIGASVKAFSHYLRCKGEMERELEQLDVMQITFLQPGPLAGPRKEKRTDEKWLQRLMKFINPLMVGPLSNYKPIESIDVAQVIIYLATKKGQVKSKQLSRLTTTQMLSLIH